MNSLTDRFTRAVEYARVAHATQVRKGTAIPYITHLLGVASLVIEHGGSEEQAIAGLLHDVIEDCGEAHEPAIREQFGNTVARIVRACTDGTAEGKSTPQTVEAKRADWLRRKQEYLKHLAEVDDEVLLVSGCDKLHNAIAIVTDLENPNVGVGVFRRFTGDRDGTLWYYRALLDVFVKHGSPVAPRLSATVARMRELADADSIPGNPKGAVQ